MNALKIAGPTHADWRTVDVDPGLESLQREVGGYIECFHLGGLTAVWNEDARRLNLKPTAWLERVDGTLLRGSILVFGPIRRGKLTDAPLDVVRQLVSRSRLLPFLLEEVS